MVQSTSTSQWNAVSIQPEMQDVLNINKNKVHIIKTDNTGSIEWAKQIYNIPM